MKVSHATYNPITKQFEEVINPRGNAYAYAYRNARKYWKNKKIK